MIPVVQMKNRCCRIKRALGFSFYSALMLAAMTFCNAQGISIATPPRIADAACGQCHRDIFEKYLATPMANASGSAMDKFEPGAFDHKPSGVSYKLFARDQHAMLSFTSSRNPEIHAERRLDYFLGSGHLGITYLYSIQGYLFESPVAYYAASHGYDMKPGLESMSTPPPALPMQANCMRCHMSAVQQSDPGTTNHYAGLPFLHSGITCEACHGNTQQHVATGGKSAVVNPQKLNAELRDSVCISCHLEGDISVERPGRSAIDYKPGESISNYLSYFVYAGKDATRRGVSEVEQLRMSMCKRSSGDRMSCTSCHDPHYTPPPQERVAFYRSKCLACHSDASFVAAHHPENPDCTSCHMPRNGAENIPHVAWTDHRIRKTPDTEDKIEDLGEGETLNAIFSPHADKRDLAMAYYNAVLEGNFAVQQKAYQMLEEIKPNILNDKDALAALGVMSEKRGNYQEATEAFEQLQHIDPENLIAQLNLGILHAKSGDLSSALALLRAAFARNENIVGLAKNLATIQCSMGDTTGARATLQRTLKYSPGLPDVERMLDGLSCSSNKP